MGTGIQSRLGQADTFDSRFSPTPSGQEDSVPLKSGSNISKKDIEEQILYSIKKGMETDK